MAQSYGGLMLTDHKIRPHKASAAVMQAIVHGSQITTRRQGAMCQQQWMTEQGRIVGSLRVGRCSGKILATAEHTKILSPISWPDTSQLPFEPMPAK